MREAMMFAGELLLKPSQALVRLRSSNAGLRPSVFIYACFLLTAVAFYSLKPEDFPRPDPMGEWPLAMEQGRSHGLYFWAKVQSWGPFLTFVEVFCLGWFSWLLKKPGTPARDRTVYRLLRMSGIALVAISPFIPMLLYKYGAISKAVFGFFLAAMIAAMIPGVQSRSLSSWRPLAALSMGLNMVNLALLIPFAAAVLFRSEAGYHALELLLMVWTIALGTYLLGGLEGMSSARAFMALMLAVVLCPMVFVISAYMLGLVPREILKAMMTV